ncbi:MAG TPA: PIG-L family deacetylase [Stellaceae bacterium]|nr:PIG-L family deacetylase [Stellaceae bacterium]
MTEPRRILILAPHPDDEVVACGIAAVRARRRGASVRVLYLTTGVPPREALWQRHQRDYAERVRRRQAEAAAAAALLGLEADCFPDIPARRLRHHLEAAAARVAAVAAAADTLWVTAYEGAHQDHDAANAVAARFRGRLPVWEFAAYNFAGGRVRANRFPAARGGEMLIEPSAEEAALKRQALGCYVSERGNLRHIGVGREICRPLPPHDYGAPPHPGRLFRERFHWVPFRHPRVDFDPSGDVYDCLERFAAEPAIPHASKAAQ